MATTNRMLTYRLRVRSSGFTRFAVPDVTEDALCLHNLTKLLVTDATKDLFSQW